MPSFWTTLPFRRSYIAVSSNVPLVSPTLEEVFLCHSCPWHIWRVLVRCVAVSQFWFVWCFIMFKFRFFIFRRKTVEEMLYPSQCMSCHCVSLQVILILSLAYGGIFHVVQYKVALPFFFLEINKSVVGDKFLQIGCFLLICFQIYWPFNL